MAYVDECHTAGPIVITKRNGKPAAVLLAPENDYDLERLLLAHSTAISGPSNRSRQSIKAGKGLSSDEFWKAVKQRQRKHRS